MNLQETDYGQFLQNDVRKISQKEILLPFPPTNVEIGIGVSIKAQQYKSTMCGETRR